MNLPIFLALIFCFINTFSQTEFKGVVIDRNDVRIPGATILLKENHLGSTDLDGKFKFILNDSSALITINMLGYEVQEVEMKA